jgi:hypothetical protein
MGDVPREMAVIMAWFVGLVIGYFLIETVVLWLVFRL